MSLADEVLRVLRQDRGEYVPPATIALRIGHARYARAARLGLSWLLTPFGADAASPSISSVRKAIRRIAKRKPIGRRRRWTPFVILGSR